MTYDSRDYIETETIFERIEKQENQFNQSSKIASNFPSVNENVGQN